MNGFGVRVRTQPASRDVLLISHAAGAASY